jgi:hypothetical protein
MDGGDDGAGVFSLSAYFRIPLQHPLACIELSKNVIANNIRVTKMAEDWKGI